jgi:hypothetical protein
MDEERSQLPMPASDVKLEEFADRWTFKIVAAMVRLIYGPVAPEQRRSIQYRLSGSLIVPYIKIPARPKEGPSPIKAILVGPCPHQEAVISATRQMCHQHGVKADVRPSAVPFRNW